MPSMQRIDLTGWITWAGGSQPVPDGTLVEFATNRPNAPLVQTATAENVPWADVVRYRVATA